MKTVEARGLVKVFGSPGRRETYVKALDGVDLSAGQGEYLVLLGPSGSGKTTLLRTIAGLDEPTEGEVFIGGHLMNGLPPRIRQVAMVFQTYALYPHKTVRANIEFPLKAEHMPRHMRERKARWAADLLDITHLLGARPGCCPAGSGSGWRWRGHWFASRRSSCSTNRCRASTPALRTSARDELKRFQQQVGTTMIYVTHDQGEAMGLADRIAVLDGGRLRQVGTPRDIYDEPTDTFVATFVGTPPMNLVPRADRLVGFRPEHLLPAENVAYDSRVTMPMRIDRMEYVSGDRHVYGSVTGIGVETRVIARLPATVATPLDGRPDP